MKKYYFVMAMLFIISTAHAQVTFGLKAGVNNSRWSGDAVGSLHDLLELADGAVVTQPRTGFYAGAFTEMHLDDRFSVQPGIYYSQKGYSLKAEVPGKFIDFLAPVARAELQSHYIDIPVLLKAGIVEGLHIYAGPQLSYLVKNNLKAEGGLLGVSLFKTNIDVTNSFKRADWSLTGGIGYTFHNGVTLSAGYDHGLTPVDRNGMFESYNRSVKVGIGFTF